MNTIKRYVLNPAAIMLVITLGLLAFLMTPTQVDETFFTAVFCSLFTFSLIVLYRLDGEPDSMLTRFAIIAAVVGVGIPMAMIVTYPQLFT